MCPERFTLAVLEMLPTVHCIKPKDILPLKTDPASDMPSIHSIQKNGVFPHMVVLMDKKMFESDAYQRVCLYLMKPSLDEFTYKSGSNIVSSRQGLKIILK